MTVRLAPRRLLAVSTVIVAVALVVWAVVSVALVLLAVRDANQALPASLRERLQRDAPPVHGDAPRTILLVGVDRARGQDGISRADSLMLLRVMPGDDRVSVLSIPRNLAMRDGRHDVQAAHLLPAGGLPALERGIERTLDLKVDHVVQVSIPNLHHAIDAVGGIDVTNEHAVRTTSFQDRRYDFPAGRIHLDGEQALAFARIRHNDLAENESDSSRANRQQLVLLALIAKLRSPSTLADPRRMPEVVRALRTDLTPRTMIAVARDVAAARDGGVVRCRLGGSWPKPPKNGGIGATMIPRPPWTLNGGVAGYDAWRLVPAAQNGRVMDEFLGREPASGMNSADAEYPLGCRAG